MMLSVSSKIHQISPKLAKKQKSIDNLSIINAFTSRGDWIRTSDHTPTRRVL